MPDKSPVTTDGRLHNHLSHEYVAHRRVILDMMPMKATGIAQSMIYRASQL
jgi:hypothetical protein